MEPAPHDRTRDRARARTTKKEPPRTTLNDSALSVSRLSPRTLHVEHIRGRAGPSMDHTRGRACASARRRPAAQQEQTMEQTRSRPTRRH